MSNGLSCCFGRLTWLLPAMPVDHQADPGNPPPSLRPHYQASPLLRDGPPPCPAPVLCPLQFPLLGVLPSAGRSNTRPAPTGRGVPTFGAAPAPSSRRLCAGHHQSSKQVSLWLIPGQQLDPGFDAIDTLSTLPQRFTHVRLPGSHLTPHRRLFRNAHHPGSFTRAACGGLGSPPAGDPGGPTSITSTAPHPDDHDLLHRNLHQRSWHTIIRMSCLLVVAATGEAFVAGERSCSISRRAGRRSEGRCAPSPAGGGRPPG